MNINDIIRKKRDGEELEEAEINFFVNGFVKGTIPDYQAAAFLMAVYLRGMTLDETAYLTFAMRDSGKTVDLSGLDGIFADKHSTGGVGDKTTLVVAPVAAACGVNMFKMSGRGLGFTGGTIDKLESIPGFRTELTTVEALEIVSRTGLVICSQSGDITPADKLIYALRDATETVGSIPLIASSIMSKKLAVGANVIVLDVKYGSGAFMKTLDEAKILADTMVRIGRIAGVKVSAVFSDMNAPLGAAVGNSLEVIEAIELLKNNPVPSDLREECIRLSAEILVLSGKAATLDEGKRLALSAIESGAALEKLREVLISQGANADIIDDYSLFKKPEYEFDIAAPKSGMITAVNCEEIGRCAAMTGAGRFKKTDIIDPSAGLKILKKTAEYVHTGEVLAHVYTDRADNYSEVAARLTGAYIIE